MNPPSPDDRKRQIVGAARACLARQGYASTTVGEVAAEAGVSRGLLHYHFKNKDELLAQVARSSVEGGARLARQLLDECRPGDDVAAGLTRGFRRLLEADPRYYFVFFECWAVARQSEVVAAEMASLYEEFREALHQGLEGALGRGAIKPRLAVGELALLLTSLFDGLGLQITAQPELMQSEAVWAAAEMGIRCALGGD